MQLPIEYNILIWYHIYSIKGGQNNMEINTKFKPNDYVWVFNKRECKLVEMRINRITLEILGDNTTTIHYWLGDAHHSECDCERENGGNIYATKEEGIKAILKGL